MQTSARLYLLWHCGFPLFVIGYALLKDEDSAKRIPQAQVRLAILRHVAATVTLALGSCVPVHTRAYTYCPASSSIGSVSSRTGFT